MNELRVDPLTGLKSIIAAGRASRPGAVCTRGRTDSGRRSSQAR